MTHQSSSASPLNDSLTLAGADRSQTTVSAPPGTGPTDPGSPNSRELFTQAAARGDNLGSITAALLRLLDRYGCVELEAAIGEALNRGVPHPNAVRLSLGRRREQREQDSPLALTLPQDQRVRNIVVRPHDLDSYDHLQSHTETDDDINNQ